MCADVYRRSTNEQARPCGDAPKPPRRSLASASRHDRSREPSHDQGAFRSWAARRCIGSLLAPASLPCLAVIDENGVDRVDPALRTLAQAAEAGRECPPVRLLLASGDLAVGSPGPSSQFLEAMYSSLADDYAAGLARRDRKQVDTEALAGEQVL